MACWCKGNCPNIAGAQALIAKSRFGQAEIELRRILTRAPLCTEANTMLAGRLTTSNRAAFAEEHLARALQNGDTPSLALKVAANLRQQAKFPDCVEAFRIAVEMNPTNSFAWAGLIGAQEAGGELDDAAENIDRVHRAGVWSAELRRVAALVFAARGDHAGAVKLLSVPDAAPIEVLDRGRYREKLGDYAGAWSDWMAAKKTLRERAGHHYNAERAERHAAHLCEISQPARAPFIRGADPLATWPRPIFVTGFPRSGTTMLEAALSAHSQITAGDELMQLSEVIRVLPAWLRAGVPYPQCLMATSQGENTRIPTLLRDFYLAKARERIGFVDSGVPVPPGRASFFTDKMPLNELHLPLIYCLFPEAAVFNVRRHPLDVIVSNMSHFLTHGGYFASSPEAAAHHVALVDDVLEHYKANVTGGRHFQTVRYESFVTDHRAVIDGMFHMLAPLTVEPACYDFHLNPWHSRTISYRQIKQPVNDSSVGRFKNFVEYLAPIIETVRPIIEREGYEL